MGFFGKKGASVGVVDPTNDMLRVAPPKAAPSTAAMKSASLVGVLQGDDRAFSKEDEEKPAFPTESFVPFTVAKTALYEIDQRASTFKTVRIEELEDLRTRAAQMQEGIKKKYVEHYTQYITDVRSAARERIELLTTTSLQRRRLDEAHLVSSLAVECARGAVERARSCSELVKQRGEMWLRLEEVEKTASSKSEIKAEAGERRLMEADEHEMRAVAAVLETSQNALTASHEHEERLVMAAEEQATRSAIRAAEHEEFIMRQAAMTEEEREAARALALIELETAAKNEQERLEREKEEVMSSQVEVEEARLRRLECEKALFQGALWPLEKQGREADMKHAEQLAVEEERRTRKECEQALMQGALWQIDKDGWTAQVADKEQAALEWAAQVQTLDSRVLALSDDCARLDTQLAATTADLAQASLDVAKGERALAKQTEQIMPLLKAKEAFEAELVVKRLELDEAQADGASCHAMLVMAQAEVEATQLEMRASVKAAALAKPAEDENGPFAEQLAKMKAILERQVESNAALQKANEDLEKSLLNGMEEDQEDDEEEAEEEAAAGLTTTTEAQPPPGVVTEVGDAPAAAPPSELDAPPPSALDEMPAAGVSKSNAALRIQLRHALESKKALRMELRQLRTDVLTVGAADDELAQKSREELRKIAKHAQLQSDHTHEELARAQTMITQMKTALAASGGGGASSEELNDTKALVAELEAELRSLKESRVAEERNAAAVAAHAGTLERAVVANAEVAETVEELAEANKNYANVATELALKQQEQGGAPPAGAAAAAGAAGAAATAPASSNDKESAAAAATASSNNAKESARVVGKMIKESIVKGTAMWKANKRAECCATYRTSAAEALEKMSKEDKWILEDGTDILNTVMRPVLTEALAQSKEQTAARGAVTLRKAFDKTMTGLAQVVSSKQPEPGAVTAVGDVAAAAAAAAAASPAAAATASSPASPAAAAEIDRLKKALEESREECVRVSELVALKKTKASEVVEESKSTEAELAASNEADRARIRDAEQKAAKLEAELEIASKGLPTGGGGGGGGGGASKKKLLAAKKDLSAAQSRAKDLEKQLAAAKAAAPVVVVEKTTEKKLSKSEQKEKEKADRAGKKLQGDLDKSAKEVERLSKELKDAQQEIDELKKKIKEFGKLAKEIDTLKLRSQDADRLEVEKKELAKRSEESEAKYMEEMKLRKKYFNQMEDMKGKIRVFARCRPMAKYEIQKDCKQAVEFVDENTLIVHGDRGAKEFTFDAVFPPNDTDPDAGQGPVFEDVSHLIQSCLDGFNVCIFAYGQTGSGKTFTMTGVRDKPDLRGVTPRAIHSIFQMAKDNAKKVDVKVSTYFLELYNDAVVDLYEQLDNPKGGTPEKLEIKLDNKKMVFVKGSVVKAVNDADELLNLFEAGNTKRHTGATKMNAESSRSHSIFAVLVEVYDKTTKKTTVGKLSLVDLAGSERADKTGATADRLKEAQAINKSLSALGDVIAALSSGEKHIPYRNNKLTMLMQDSLGGNAKTLMFVNISPADYNTDETATSLTYAARVKLIKNNANKNAESEEVAQLKAMIKNLRAGGNGEIAGVEIQV